MTDNNYQYGEFCWNELMTPNVSEAKKFYSDLLGWEYVDYDMGNMMYTMVKKGNKELAGIMQTPTEKESYIPPHWMSYILVENVEEVVKKAEKLGATITVPVTSVADFGRLAIVADPTGANVAFWEPLEK